MQKEHLRFWCQPGSRRQGSRGGQCSGATARATLPAVGFRKGRLREWWRGKRLSSGWLIPQNVMSVCYEGLLGAQLENKIMLEATLPLEII